MQAVELPGIPFKLDDSLLIIEVLTFLNCNGFNWAIIPWDYLFKVKFMRKACRKMLHIVEPVLGGGTAFERLYAIYDTISKLCRLWNTNRLSNTLPFTTLFFVSVGVSFKTSSFELHITYPYQKYKRLRYETMEIRFYQKTTLCFVSCLANSIHSYTFFWIIMSHIIHMQNLKMPTTQCIYLKLTFLQSYTKCKMRKKPICHIICNFFS